MTNSLRLPWTIRGYVGGYVLKPSWVILDCDNQCVAECDLEENAKAIVKLANQGSVSAVSACKCRASKAGPGLVAIRKVSLQDKA